MTAPWPRHLWLPGMLTHTTHPGGFPECQPGTPILVESLHTLEDCVVEGMFGPITPEPAPLHPDFEEVYAQHDRDTEAAWSRVRPDFTAPATLGCLLHLAREAHHTLASTEYVGDGDPQQPWRFLSFRGRTEGEVLEKALLSVEEVTDA